MERIKKFTYIKSVYPDYRFNESKNMVHYSEVNIEDRFEERRIIKYSNGLYGVANSFGSFNDEVLTHGHLFEDNLMLELNNPPEITTEEISLNDFENEWNKVVSLPGFYLKPYSE